MMMTFSAYKHDFLQLSNTSPSPQKSRRRRAKRFIGRRVKRRKVVQEEQEITDSQHQDQPEISSSPGKPRLSLSGKGGRKKGAPKSVTKLIGCLSGSVSKTNCSVSNSVIESDSVQQDGLEENGARNIVELSNFFGLQLHNLKVKLKVSEMSQKSHCICHICATDSRYRIVIRFL
eukprot:sb/3471999/